MNAPIQGSAADIIKVAMVRAWRNLRDAGLEARLILTVHDELIVECPQGEAVDAGELLQQAMEEAAQLSVPLTAEVGVGQQLAGGQVAVELEIRPMTRETVPMVAVLEQLCFPDPWSAKSLRQELDSPQSVFLTAWAGEALAGYAGLRHVLDEGTDHQRGGGPALPAAGVAEALMNRLAAFGREQGLATLMLEVRAGNAPAIALYEKLGYRRVGLRTGYYRRPAEDAVLMTLWLEQTH